MSRLIMYCFDDPEFHTLSCSHTLILFTHFAIVLAYQVMFFYLLLVKCFNCFTYIKILLYVLAISARNDD